MAEFDCAKLFNAESIRDTNVKTSVVEDSRSFNAETIAVENGLNETITFQLQGSPLEDFSIVFDISGTFTTAANTNSYETVDVKFLYYRLTAQSVSTAPTTGDLTVYIIKGE